MLILGSKKKATPVIIDDMSWLNDNATLLTDTLDSFVINCRHTVYVSMKTCQVLLNWLPGKCCVMWSLQRTEHKMQASIVCSKSHM